MPNFGHGFLALGESDDSFVVNEQPVGVLDLEVVRVSGVQFNDAATNGFCENLVQSQLEQLFLVFQFLSHRIENNSSTDRHVASNLTLTGICSP